MTTVRAIKDALTLPKFLAWAKAKPGRKEWNYDHSHNCALAQYLKSEGFDVSVGGFSVATSTKEVEIPKKIFDALHALLDSRSSYGEQFTFAKLVKALEHQQSR